MLGNGLSESPAPKIPTIVAVKKEWDMSEERELLLNLMEIPFRVNGSSAPSRHLVDLAARGLVIYAMNSVR